MIDFFIYLRFVLVDSKEEVDILWIREYFKDFRLVLMFILDDC